MFEMYANYELLDRITVVPGIFGGKPIIRGRRLAVEHVLDMLAAGDDPRTILSGYPWLEPDDIRACLLFEQWMDCVERDWFDDREWEMDVEESDLGSAGRLEGDEVYREWAVSVEPDYDSEEEKFYSSVCWP